MLTIAFFIFGMVFLIKGGDWLVDGASSIAKKFHISDLAIGLTIVAFGTSAPELVVNIVSSIQGNTDIAISNVLGSNIANILLILGVAAIIYPLRVSKGTVWKEIPFSLLAVLLLGVMSNDIYFDKISFSALTRTDGFALVAFLVIFLYYVFGIAKSQGDKELQEEMAEEETVKNLSVGRSTVFVLLGLGALIIGGKLVVDSAVSIATNLGVSESLIGLTIVAIGTSLPELVTSAIAAYKKNADIAVGNVVGSNIFNIFWILGISAIINPLPIAASTNMDIFVVFLATLLLFSLMFIGKKHHLERRDGIFYVGLYITYLTFLVYRG